MVAEPILRQMQARSPAAAVISASFRRSCPRCSCAPSSTASPRLRRRAVAHSAARHAVLLSWLAGGAAGQVARTPPLQQPPPLPACPSGSAAQSAAAPASLRAGDPCGRAPRHASCAQPAGGWLDTPTRRCIAWLPPPPPARLVAQSWPVTLLLPMPQPSQICRRRPHLAVNLLLQAGWPHAELPGKGMLAMTRACCRPAPGPAPPHLPNSSSSRLPLARLLLRRSSSSAASAAAFLAAAAVMAARSASCGCGMDQVPSCAASELPASVWQAAHSRNAGLAGGGGGGGGGGRVRCATPMRLAAAAHLLVLALLPSQHLQVCS
jgi:hypothetical protein